MPKEILDIPKLGFLNVHYSLLPRWRGPSPIQAAILAGDLKTGVTISKVVPKVDAGDIITEEEIQISKNETYFEIERKLDEIGKALLVKSIPLWLAGKILPQKQDESRATYSKLIKTEDGKIDWSKAPEEILRQIRALSPAPGVFAFLNKKRLLMLKASIENSEHPYKLGEIVRSETGFKIACKNGFLIPLLIKLEGKKETTPKSFLDGHKNIIRTVLA